jgi:hypothetical protein
MAKKKNNWDDKKSFHVEVPLFKVDILFLCDLSESEIPVHIKRFAGEENFKEFDQRAIKGWDYITNEGRKIDFLGGFIVLVKNKNGNFREFVSILVHEITHVTHYLLRDRRIPLTVHTEELYCYLTEYLTEQALIKLYD